MSNEMENENRRRIDKLENKQETNEKIQEANMEILRAEHRTSHEEVLRRIAEQGKEMAEQGKEIIRTVMLVAFGIIGAIGVAVIACGEATAATRRGNEEAMSIWKAKRPGRPGESVTLRCPSARTDARTPEARHSRNVVRATKEKTAAQIRLYCQP